MIHTEAERQFYLGVAGVRLWYARSPLPGAAPSPEFEFPEEASAAPGDGYRVPQEPAAEVTPVATRKPSEKGGKPSGAVNLQALMETSKPEASRKESPSPATGPEAQPEAENGGLPNEARSAAVESEAALFRQKLNLRFWFGRRFVLVSDLSGEASLRLQETLATNILKSIGDQDARVLGPVLWPVFNNPLLPGNRLPDLVDVLKGVLEPLDGQQVILLGVPGSGDESAGEHWFAQALGKEPVLVFSHTLAELAGNPELKKQLWLRLKPFV